MKSTYYAVKNVLFILLYVEKNEYKILIKKITSSSAVVVGRKRRRRKKKRRKQQRKRRGIEKREKEVFNNKSS